MPSTFSTNKDYELQATGEHVNTWGIVLNQNFQTIDANLAGSFPVTITSADVTLTDAQASNLSYAVTGTLTGDRALVFPQNGGFFIINNGTSGAYSLTVRMATGASVIVPQGEITFVYSNGTGMFAAASTASTVIDGSGAPTAPAPDGTVYYDITAIQFHVRVSGAWVAATPSYSPKTANTVLAGPASGGSATPTYRALVSDDIPLATTSDKGGVLLGSATPQPLGTAATGTSTAMARQDHVHSNNNVALVGTPTAPTAAVDTNTTQIATTAYVIGQAASATPSNLGPAAVGTSLRFARQDHVHKGADLASVTEVTGILAASHFPALTGDVTTVAGAVATTLSNTGVSAGSYGSASAVGTFTVDGKGRLTAAANVNISIPSGAVTGLGTMATQNANNVAITGGSITGITDLAVADGGTGASNAAKARANLRAARGVVVNAPAASTMTGTAWTIRTSAADNQWRGIAWSPELGLFAAVSETGTGNRVMTSPDGITWTSRTSATNNNWFAIAWAPELGIFCAVGYSGTGNRVMTSPDGITWTSRTSAADNQWRGVAWSPELGLFAAVASTGTGNRVMTSPDGITWTARASAVDNDWFAIAWSPELGLFAAVASTGTGSRVMTSPDGITWTSRTSAADNDWFAIAWAPELGLFAAVASTGTGNRVMTSPDGITWTARTSAADNNWFAIAWAPELGIFCAVSYSGAGNRVMTSPDGITWTARTSAADNDWFAIAWAPELGLFATVSRSGAGNRVMTSVSYPGSVTLRRRNPGYRARGDADATLIVGTNAVYQNVTATLTANRTITLSASYAVAGDMFKIKRTGLGAFTLAIVNGGPAAGTLKTFASATAGCATFVFDGINWIDMTEF